jgi:hypothetical protein
MEDMSVLLRSLLTPMPATFCCIRSILGFGSADGDASAPFQTRARHSECRLELGTMPSLNGFTDVTHQFLVVMQVMDGIEARPADLVQAG